MGQTWGTILGLSAGGALGVNARFWLGYGFSRWVTHPFPWATFIINVTGSFAIGFLTIALTHWHPHPQTRVTVLVGFVGGYTTFSTYAFDTFALWEGGAVWLALANVAGSTVAGLLAVGLGIGLGRALIVPVSSTDAPVRVKADAQGPAMPTAAPGQDNK